MTTIHAQLFLRSCAAALASACLACFSPLPAAAQSTPPAASAEEPAASQKYDPQDLKKRGDAIIAAGDGVGVWVAVPDDRNIVLLHPASGLKCSFLPSNPAKVMVTPMMKRGDDVICATNLDSHTAITTYATRQLEPLTLDQELTLSASAVLTVNPKAKLYNPGFALSMGNDAALPASRTASFAFETPEGHVVTKVSVAIVNGWVIKMRFTQGGMAKAEGNMQADLIAGMGWLLTMTDLQPAQPQP